MQKAFELLVDNRIDFIRESYFSFHIRVSESTNQHPSIHKLSKVIENKAAIRGFKKGRDGFGDDNLSARRCNLIGEEVIQLSRPGVRSKDYSWGMEI